MKIFKIVVEMSQFTSALIRRFKQNVLQPYERLKYTLSEKKPGMPEEFTFYWQKTENILWQYFGLKGCEKSGETWGVWDLNLTLKSHKFQNFYDEHTNFKCNGKFNQESLTYEILLQQY